MQRALHAQAVEQHCGIRLRRVAAFLANDTFELPKPHPVGVRQFVVWLGIECAAFFERLPQRCIAHNDRVDDAIFVERKLILPQNTHLLGPGNRAAGGVDLPRQDLHKRGLTCAIRPGDGVAAPRHEGTGHVLE